MTQQVLASYRSVQAEITSFQATAQRQSLDVRINGNQKSSHLLNRQERQIVDDVGISEEALKKLDDLRQLEQQLKEYLDYLKGHDRGYLVTLSPRNEESAVEIQGRSTNISASITVASYHEETLEIAASVDDDGNISELTITKTETTSEFVQAEFILEDTQFYAAIS